MGQTEDLSKHGLKACFTAPLPEADVVTLAVDGGSEIHELRLSGRPMWRQDPRDGLSGGLYRYGFEFSQLTPALRLAVDELLGKLNVQSASSRRGAPAATPRVKVSATRPSLKQ